ncbi:MAG TPA: right-handed parallel beta-helix repeat-containing protein [Gammaproteobacteria bacterium]|nr:right-handed parallel beta-helix repeat-containing protein [Gammaproteobacteria bacterium]
MRIAGFLALFVSTSCSAATYYVSNDGNDRASGKSAAEAWATLDKVNRQSFKTGDVVLFRDGDRWQGKLAVDWSGTASAYATVGAYHLENGTAVKGSRERRPIIEGAGRFPGGGIYDALIMVNTRDYVRIEDIEVRNSEGRGIGFARANFGDVVNVVVDGAYVDGIHFLKSDHGSVSRSFVTHAGLVFPRDGRKHAWAAAITFVGSDSGRVVESTVAETYGEGINTNHGSTGTLIENNRVFAVRAVGIYADAAPKTTIRGNIVVGTAKREFWRGGQSVGAGIAINDEKYNYKAGGGSLPDDVQSKDAKIEGNVVVYTSTGIALWSAVPQASHDNLIVAGNTLIDNDRQISGLGTKAPGGLLADNVLLSLSKGTSDVDSAKLSGLTARNNYFSQGDPGGDLGHAGNRREGIAVRETGWRSIDSIDDVDWDELARLARSSRANEARAADQN